MIRLIWLLTGILSLTLGIIGIFLPLLPTVPLVLLAAIAFSKSSPALYTWLTCHKFFGLIVKEWQQERTIPVRAKISLLILTTISIFLSTIYLITRK